MLISVIKQNGSLRMPWPLALSDTILALFVAFATNTIIAAAYRYYTRRREHSRHATIWIDIGFSALLLTHFVAFFFAVEFLALDFLQHDLLARLLAVLIAALLGLAMFFSSLMIGMLLAEKFITLIMDLSLDLILLIYSTHYH